MRTGGQRGNGGNQSAELALTLAVWLADHYMEETAKESIEQTTPTKDNANNAAFDIRTRLGHQPQNTSRNTTGNKAWLCWIYHRVYTNNTQPGVCHLSSVIANITVVSSVHLIYPCFLTATSNPDVIISGCGLADVAIGPFPPAILVC